MRGSIVKRGKNSWALVIPLGKDPATGRKQQKWFAHKTRGEAERHLAQILLQMQDGTWAPPAKVRLSAYLDRWLDHMKNAVRPTTHASYEIIAKKHLGLALGHVPLALLAPQGIQAYLDDKLRPADGKALSPTTVRHHAMVLHKALHQAVRWGLLPQNPCDRVDLPRMQQHDMRVLDDEQTKLFLAEARRSSPHYRLYLAAVTTGMRQGELLGLRWRDVDFVLGRASVQQTFYRLGKQQLFSEPKTGRGRRSIALPSVLVEGLRRLREEQKEARRLLGAAYQEHDLVFCQADGKPLHGHNLVRRDFHEVLKRAKLPRIRFHDLRHGCATLLLQQGVHPKVVQEWLGHSTPAFTLAVYSHVLPGMQEQAARTLEGRLLGESATD